VKSGVQLKGSVLKVGSISVDLEEYDRVFVVGAGKASGAMAEAVEEILGDRIIDGLVNVQKGTAQSFRTKRIRLNEAGHPIPDEGGLKGARNITKLLADVKESDLVISLISGGGSALLPLPVDNITLAEKQDVTNSLLRCGATIDEVNIVRKHVSGIKGGRLARHTYPATLICLLISDVVGDPLPSIASGPTVPDPSTYSDAIGILKRYDVWESLPQAIRQHLNRGLEGKAPESPKPGDPHFKKVHNIILGSNRIALKAAGAKAMELALTPTTLSSFVEGEARHVGTVIASLARETAVSESFLRRPIAVLMGGETTVAVTGSGRGGRNQELVLSASLRINGLEGVAIASAGTDGLDGSTDAAGAIVDGSTARRAQEEGMNPVDYLDNNDSYHFFRDLEDLIITGPTGTNVNDVMILVSL